MQEVVAEAPRITEETTTGAVQAGSQEGTLTTLDLGGRSAVGSTGAAHNAEAGFDEFSTPMAVAAPKGKTASTWLPGVEPPRWLQRLGSFLNVPGPGSYQVEFPPSPFPGASPPYTPPPPGGPTFRLRSPARPKAIHPAPTPPSSSSVPAEAIQAEVQRQLGGILGQLRDYSERNDKLQMELDDARATLRALQSGNGGEQEGLCRDQSRLLGDLATARLDPGLLGGSTVPAEYQQQPQPDPCVPEGVPVFHQRTPMLPVPPKGPREEPQHQPKPSFHGYDSSRRLDENLPDGDLRAGTQGTAGPTGLLRTWWESRQREPTPPPRPTTTDGRDSPVLDALTNNSKNCKLKHSQELPHRLPLKQ